MYNYYTVIYTYIRTIASTTPVSRFKFPMNKIKENYQH